MPTLHDAFRALSLAARPQVSASCLLQPPSTRRASVLSSLRPNPSGIRTRKRLGRGPASGKGKTSGRGHKGQKQHGKVPAGFQGGQTPAEVTHGKRGVQSRVFQMDLRKLNVDRLQSWVDQGRLDPSRMITVKELQRSRCLHGVGEGVKLLARNAETLKTPVHIVVSWASAAAIKAVEDVGGSVQTRYYTKASLSRIMQGKTHPFLSRLSPGAYPSEQSETTESSVLDTASSTQEWLAEEPTADILSTPTPGTTASPIQSAYPPPATFRYRLPDAFARKDLEYYRDPAHRGYLAYQLAENAGPSLYFKSPQKLKEEREERKRRKEIGGEEKEVKFDTGRIW